ncbi:proprotein convertase subtilisin/kexin type 5 isoform X1 [Tachysurus fulvidraco]|uniref:proprotein convertase subtilisin/kexin type 5 isoform X1 n=1 Tax=Tachysurus fulvidraco TaxID=1234273 RepID=UPI001FEFB50F|nr:proprotein convertase subtilisin/kexin type 5 isoform X1 [Tachysurus fulvidraco]
MKMRFRALQNMSAVLTQLLLLQLGCIFISVQAKASSVSCPSGQFAFKNRCVFCHPTCAECEGHELFQCTACGSDEDGRERFLYQGHCRAHCPREFYPDREQYTCLPCIANCEICVNGNICTKCREGYKVQSGICLPVPCGVGEVHDPESGECIECETGCSTCSTDDPEYCNSCTDDYFLYRHQCRQHCPQRTYEESSRGVCLSCPESCLDCRSETLCLICQPGQFLHNGACVNECPQDMFGDARGWRCQPCHSSCLTCHGPGARDCDRCKGLNSPIYGRCPVISCPEGQYFDSGTRDCRYCDVSCRTCYGPTAQNCNTCSTGYMLEQQEAVCVHHCPVGFYGNSSSQQCERCSSNCETCDSGDQCLSCQSGSYQLFLFQGSCWSECPDGYFETAEGTCDPCDDLCLTCDGSRTQCLACRDGRFLENSMCRDNCSVRTFAAEDGTCRRCGPHCDTCIDTSACTRCTFLYLLLNGMCKASCPEGYFEDLDQGVCVQCHESCATCSGPLSDDCESCSSLAPKLYEGTCSEDCPAGTYYQTTSMECQECHQTCALCTGPEATQCTQCVKGLALDPNTMMCGVTGDSDCPPRTFLHANQFTCQACHHHCQSCEGPASTDCQTCALPRYLHNNSCVTECTLGTYSAHEEADGIELGFCMPCDHVCATCSGASSKDCLSCSPGYLHLLSHLCVRHCPTGYYSTGKHCEKCHESCEMCSGPEPDACMVCVPPLLELQGTRVCVEHCPPRFYQSAHTCRQCHTSCKSCTDNTPQSCLTCDWGSILQEGVCYPRCEEGQYYSQNEVCEACDESCKHCSGPGPESCLTCHPEFGLHAVTRRCLVCCQPDEPAKNCCLCHSASALCLETPASAHNKAEDDELNLRSRVYQHTSAALPAALILAVVLALGIFALAQARARKRLCWRQSYERLSGTAGARPDPRTMPHGVPEPEDSGDDADVVYTSRDGSIYRRYGFIHKPESEEEEGDEASENTLLNRT